LSASIANAALVCLPACVINGGYASPYAALTVFVAALCEGLAISPQRVGCYGTENRLAMLWNILQGVVVLITLQVFTVMGNTSPLGGTQWALIGLAALIIGLVLRSAAIRTLGEHFSDGFQPSAASRVIAGPYCFIRHPAELGLLMMIAGFGTVLCGWTILTITLFAAMTIVSTVRIFIEEVAMQDLSAGATVTKAGQHRADHLVQWNAARSHFWIGDDSAAKDRLNAFVGNAYR
jgi:protein-S-isoprenylcysteine O-methyltransferase Ste14